MYISENLLQYLFAEHAIFVACSVVVNRTHTALWTFSWVTCIDKFPCKFVVANVCLLLEMKKKLMLSMAKHG